MKPLFDLDHYETLEIARDASREDVGRAYQLARATFAEDSIAGYSVFEEGDASAMRERIELAYRTLSDPASRAAYDADLAREPQPESATPTPDSEPAAEDPLPAAASPPLSLPELPEGSEEETSGDYDGARLRRIRLSRGVELEEIAGVTKVSPAYLDFIEQERFEDLPAAVYVRGFVMGYATCIGLDAARVARSYMQRFEDRRKSPRRGLFARG